MLPELIRRRVALVGDQKFSKNGLADCPRLISDRQIDIDSLLICEWILERTEGACRLLEQQKSGECVVL